MNRHAWFLVALLSLTAACADSVEEPEVDAADAVSDAPDVSTSDIVADSASDDDATDGESDLRSDAQSDTSDVTEPDADLDVPVDTTPDTEVDVATDAETDTVDDVDAETDTDDDVEPDIDAGAPCALFSDQTVATASRFSLTGAGAPDLLADHLLFADLDGANGLDLLLGTSRADNQRGQLAAVFSPFSGDQTLADASVEVDGVAFFDGLGAIATGDFNDDGNLDLAAGALGISTVYVWEGPRDWAASPPTVEDASVVITGARGDQVGAFLVAGDVDGDGDDELVISMPSYGANGPGGLSIVGLDGPPTSGTIEAVTTVYASDVGFANYGAQAILGDFNGDGQTDIVVGSGQDMPEPNGGGAHLIPGPVAASSVAVDIDTVISQSVVGLVDQRKMCERLHAVPSTNSNASDDFICSTNTGDAFLFDFATITGDGTDADALASFTADAGRTLGVSVAGGDVDGDNVGDVLLGAGGESAGSGAVYVFLGGSGHTGTVELEDADAVIVGEDASALGERLYVGDQDADGFADIAVSAPSVGVGGTVYVLAGCAP